ncbi:hypothetical protein [Salipiger marinus]|uniref:Uncharacterized protein n=1 Tax=Salipiger marinus TaxID=555512 RepID=A0A1G8PTA4_9RHOB|nr:hypothetical protein [Salipiger marinus]SDI95734.1 hypothetical protein SAMN04487993_1013106 [Salipiger marinus]
MPPIYDWRSRLCNVGQVFLQPGQSDMGGMTLGGFLTENPEPGGRYHLRMSFPPFWKDRARNKDASWTITRLSAGAIMRIPLLPSVQLVSAADLGGTDAGQPWANGEPWANSENWGWRPAAPVAASAARGSASFQADLSEFGQVLVIGDVIGFSQGNLDFAHKVMDISYSAGDVATISVSPPLRRAVTTDDAMQFRPRVMVVCRNAASALVGLTRRNRISLGELQFVEALL